MINLRYHVVSLIAVFLALGMGIVMGSTVIDRVTVDALNNRLEGVRRSVNGIREENRVLGDQVRSGRDFADQSAALIVSDRLVGVPVMVVAVTGIDRKPVESLRALMVQSGATLSGTVWVLPRMRLATEADLRGLAAALDLPPVDPDTMRRLALARLLADSSKEPVAGGTLSSLVEAGFVSFDPPPEPTTSKGGGTGGTVPSSVVAPTSTTAPASTSGSAPATDEVAKPGTRYVVISGAGAQVGDDLLALPLAQALAATSGRGVAAEAGEDIAGGRGVFVGLIRDDPNVSSRLSTVDNLESPMGQVATIIAIEGLLESRVGHFGVGPGSQRLVPAAE